MCGGHKFSVTFRLALGIQQNCIINAREFWGDPGAPQDMVVSALVMQAEVMS